MTIDLLFILLTGLAFGSFVTLASYRLPLGEDIVVKPSRCPTCEAKLNFFDLWPVLSWVMSGAKCRHCHTRISARYPLTELATAAMLVLLYLHYGFTLQAGILAFTWVAMMVMIVVDLEHFIIPDQVQIALALLAIAYHMVMKTDPVTVAGGFILGAVIGLSLHYGYRWIRKKEGLGFGDVKFLAVAGLWLGVLPMVPFLFFSGVFGVVTGLTWRAMGKGPVFPFGPALALALFASINLPQISYFFWNIGHFAR